MNILNKKRKAQEFEVQQEEKENQFASSEALKPENFFVKLKRQKQKGDRVNSDLNQGKKVEKIPIKLKELSAIEKGFFNVPKEVIEEFIAYKYQVLFLPKNDNGNNTYYYYYDAAGCQYRIKIKENLNLLKSITSASLISSFTNFDLSNPSELSEGICHLTEYGEHINNHNKEQNQKIEFKKLGIFLFPYLFNFIRSFSLSKTNN